MNMFDKPQQKTVATPETPMPVIDEAADKKRARMKMRNRAGRASTLLSQQQGQTGAYGGDTLG